MALALDRDLLTFEPDLFRDAGWAGQRLVSGTGTISGTTLSLTAYDVNLEDAGVAGGHVAVVDGVPCEVVGVSTGTTATVSRLRASPADPPITPSPVTGRPVTIATMRPQIAAIERQVLRMLGIEPSATPGPGVLGVASITNPEALRRLTALGTLHLVFAAAAALTPPESPHWVRAELYRARFARERHAVAALIDADGDGVPDSTRRLNVMQLLRG